MSPYVLLTKDEATMAFGLDPKQFGLDLKHGVYDGTFVFTPGGERRFKAGLLDRRIEELCIRDGNRAAEARSKDKLE